MNGAEVALWAGAFATVVTAIGTVLRARHNSRIEISSDERQARRDVAEDRRDTIADRDKLLATVLEEVRELRGRVEVAERGIRIRDDHIDALEHDIYQGKPPPPRPRPEGI